MKWSKSKCKGNLLHSYKIAKTFPTGVVEICTRCKDRQFFHNKIPNAVYLEYHLRQALQRNNPRFIREYQQQ